MTFMEDGLRRLYEHTGEFFMIIRPNGIIVVEDPDDGNGKEAVLRLFMTPHEAIAYKDQEGFHPEVTSVRRTTLTGLWSLLPRIDNLTKAQFQAPVRVDVSVFSEDGVFTIDTLHSSYSLPS